MTDGSTYTGSFKNNLRDGYGKNMLQTLEAYQGQYKEGKTEGYGLYLYPNNDVFDGQFKDGKKSGEGFYKFAETGRIDKIIYEDDIVVNVTEKIQNS